MLRVCIYMFICDVCVYVCLSLCVCVYVYEFMCVALVVCGGLQES